MWLLSATWVKETNVIYSAFELDEGNEIEVRRYLLFYYYYSEPLSVEVEMSRYSDITCANIDFSKLTHAIMTSY